MEEYDGMIHEIIIALNCNTGLNRALNLKALIALYKMTGLYKHGMRKSKETSNTVRKTIVASQEAPHHVVA